MSEPPGKRVRIPTAEEIAWYREHGDGLANPYVPDSAWAKSPYEVGSGVDFCDTADWARRAVLCLTDCVEHAGRFDDLPFQLCETIKAAGLLLSELDDE